ncbi:MAG: response regulator [Chitinivibrionales bacterium]|nr:response regulator [Chitinivibrionales bacterium]
MKPDNEPYRILVVDDEPEIRDIITEYLQENEKCAVLSAENGKQALEQVLPQNRFDCVISDINMPYMKGFEFLNEVQKRYPDVIRVLITAYNVEEYLEYALKHDIGNIFVKTVPFNFPELGAILKNLLTRKIFGLDHYFNGEAATQSFTLRDIGNLYQDVQTIVKVIPEIEKTKRLELVLVEMLTNAVFYGILNESAENKEQWNHNIMLSEKDAIAVTLRYDAEKYAISVTDNGGRLCKKDVLFWLNRQISQGGDGLPVGVGDSHGRGLFIARSYIDRLIINIEHDKKTEIIVMNYFKPYYKGYKPLHINEI